MDKPSGDTTIVTVIGDLVASKRQADRTEVQQRLTSALADVSNTLPAIQPLDVTIGDEFQGVYGDLSTALHATLLVRLTLLPHVDARFGIGRGTFTIFDANRHPMSQDGPAWWAARQAVDTTSRLADQPRTRHSRTWYVESEPGCAPAVNAFLSCRDDILGRMNDRARRLLLHSLLGKPQAAMALEEGITQSAVSQSLVRSGAYAVMKSAEFLGEF